MDSTSDEELVRQIVDTSNQKLFGVLYDRYDQKVYHKCLSFAKNSDDAQDMLHDIFLKIYTKLSSFSGKSSFSTWLYSITYNYCVDYARNKSTYRSSSIDDVREVSEMEDEANEKALMEAQAQQLQEALGRINPLEKAVLLMKFQDGLSIKEIVEMTALSESAVKMRIKRAKAHALDQYKQLYQSEDR